MMAKALANAGAKKVYLAARNPDKAAQCIKRIQDSLPAKSSNSNEAKTVEILFHQLDLADPKEAKRSAEAFMQKEERLDVLSTLQIDSLSGENCVAEFKTP